MLQDFELAALLSEHYAQPLPSGNFHASVVRRMQVTAISRRRRNRAVAVLATATSLAVVSASTWWAYTSYLQPRFVMEEIPGVYDPMPLRPPGPIGVKLGDFGPEQALNADSLVLRPQIAEVKGTTIHYKVLRTIFGQTKEQILDMDFTHGHCITHA